MQRKHPFVFLVVAVGMCACCGCRPAALQTTPSGPPTLTVSRPIMREVTDYRVFTGTTGAVKTVDVQARVTGYLVQLPFTEGATVRAGELLAQIDPRPYQAKFDAANGEVALQRAELNLAQKDYERAKAIRAENAGAVSQQELDTREAKVEEAAAAVDAAKANLEQYRLDLEFTKVYSPIDGRVSRYYLNVGNLVTQNVTLITTVVSQSPIYVYFDVDEQTLLRALRGMYQQELPPIQSGKLPIQIGFQDNTGFPHSGTVDFANNVVDSATGTIVLRGVFANPPNDAGVRLLLPGMFVRVKFPLGKPHTAPLIAEKAVTNDQGSTYVYVVDEQDKVQYRRVDLGRTTDDGLETVENGLTSEDRIVVSGIQFAKPGEKVQVEEKPMPTAGASQSETASTTSPGASPTTAKPDAQASTQVDAGSQ